MKTLFSVTFFSILSAIGYGQMYDQAIQNSWATAGNPFVNFMEYGHWTLNQSAPIQFSGETLNLGSVIQTGAKFNVDITGAETFSASSAPVDLGIGASDSMGATITFTPATIGTYNVVMYFDGTNAEEVTDNDTAYWTFYVHATDFGRDDGTITGGFSTIAGSPESVLSVGNVMQIFSDDNMTSLKVGLTNNPDNIGQFIYGEVWLFDSGFGEFTWLDQTDDHLITAGENGSMIELDFFSEVSVAAGDTILITAGHYGGPVTPEFTTAQSCEEYTVLVNVDFSLYYLLSPSAITVRAVFDTCAYVGAAETVTQISCNGEVDGEITMVPESMDYLLIWLPDDTTNMITGLAEGFYPYTIIDTTNGCVVVDSIEIIEPDVLGLAAASTNELFGFDADINLNVTGGTTPYAYSWIGPGGFTSTDEDPTSLEGGTYTVYVTDDNGCMDSLVVIVDSELSIGAQPKDSFELYPNPSTSTVYFSKELESVSVFNAQGQLVMQLETVKEIDLSKQPAGLYLIRSGTAVRRLQKL